MKLFGFNIQKEETKSFQPEPRKEEKKSGFVSFSYTRPETPAIVEKKDKDYILYGLDNLYPQKLKDLLRTSAIHNAIVVGKAQMMAGDGFLLNNSKTKQESDAILTSLPIDVQEKYKRLLDNDNGIEHLYDVLAKCSKDYQTYGAFAMEVIWNVTYTNIATIKYLEVANVRSGKLSNGKVTKYYYSRDWSDVRNNKPYPISTFDKDSKKLYDNGEAVDYNQIIYVKGGTLEYYGEPAYEGAMSWINIDSQMGLFHLSNIENGFAPSVAFKFYEKPGSPEAEHDIKNAIKKEWAGAKNAGKGLVFFSDGKELAPDVEPINVSNLDKQFLLLADQAVQQILSGHRVTSPLLFGISVPGSLGGNTELQTAYTIFNNAVIQPDRAKLERVMNMILEVNQIPVKITINPFNPTV